MSRPEGIAARPWAGSHRSTHGPVVYHRKLPRTDEALIAMESTLIADVRDDTGKGAARRLRASGRVPGILYGHGMEPVKLSISGKDLLHLFHSAGGGSTLVDLKVDGKTHLAIPREIQRDHLHGRFIHIDFLAVRRDEKITLAVEVHEVGEAPGIRAGGVIEHHLREIEIECLPKDVPENDPRGHLVARDRRHAAGR
jgi:large subunit ribosomal protein L25